MNPLTAEWVQKAEADYLGAVYLRRHRKIPLPDLVCFHCQQSAEKYLKAFLQEAGATFPKTHNLLDLLQLLMRVNPSLKKLQADLLVLEDYAVKFRYPGISSTLKQAAEAMRALASVRKIVRRTLGLT